MPWNQFITARSKPTKVSMVNLIIRAPRLSIQRVWSEIDDGYYNIIYVAPIQYTIIAGS